MHRKQRQTQIAGTNPRRRGDSPVTRPQSGPTRRARESGGGMREGDQLVRLPRPRMISEPEVTINERTECCDFLVIESDGLWDVVSNEGTCQVVGRCLDAHKKMRSSEGMRRTNAAALLAQLALARGSKDKITVIVVELNKSSA
ncbi:hypothetical protein DVH24_040085 [Malus domestica]|uniref:PPM-type phosphatase domain-containing protein n=1 Tax=Malus domestica TaxID=3750 RepID=A0A498I7G3_MALDO|nr:hypothetical protein DVH24_040085 [Malus domestica]